MEKETKPFEVREKIEEMGKDFGERLNFDEMNIFLKSFRLEKVSNNFIRRLCLLDLKRGEVERPHFQDAIEIAEMAPNLLSKQKNETDDEFNERKNNLRAAGVVHDVGKSGTARATQEQQVAFVNIFNLHFYRKLYAKEFSEEEKKEKGKAYEDVKFVDLPLDQALKHKVHEMVFTSGISENNLKLILAAINEQENFNQLNDDVKINAASKMYKLLGAHVYWTADILKKEKVDEKIILYASSHHFLDGRNPLMVDIDKLSDADLEAIASLEMADKYQAMRNRSHVSHDQFMDIYRRSIENKVKTNESLDCVKIGNVEFENVERFKNAYLTTLKRIDENREILEKEMALDEESIRKRKEKKA